MINKSFDSINTKSAGIRLPAFNFITSPTTTCSVFISDTSSSLNTCVVVNILLFNSWLNLYTLYSWKYLINADTIATPTIM